MQSEDPRHSFERSGLDGVERTARAGFLPGLKDQSHPVWRRRRREYRRRAHEHRGVRIVAAGVGNPWDGGRVGQAGGLGDRKRVEVGAQRHRFVRRRPDIAPQAGATRQYDGCQPEADQMSTHHVGGAVFFEGQFRIRMEIPAPGDQ